MVIAFSFSQVFDDSSDVPAIIRHLLLDAPTPCRYNLPAVVRTVVPTQVGTTQFIKEKDPCLHIQNASTRRAAGITAAPTMPCSLATSPHARTAVPCAFRTRSARIADSTKGAKWLK